eukprot:Skav223397  [mRNA]  locus=scaffold2634:560453:563617:- [translate_table: standard]
MVTLASTITLVESKANPKKRSLESDGDIQHAPKWRIRLGERAKGIRNPIREIMDTIAGKENPAKTLVSLAQGDPTCYPHLRPSVEMVSAVSHAVNSGQNNGYQPSQGNARCRAAVANFFNTPGRPTLQAKAVPGEALATCDYHGVEVRYYDLLPDKGWQCNIGDIAKLVDSASA